MTAPWLERTELLLGSAGLAALQGAHVLVVGLGGVGAYAAEMLARGGVGQLTLVDSDTVAESNINRQLIALHSTVGRPKTSVLAERLSDINPAIQLTIVRDYIQEDTLEALLDAAPYSFVVDAIDTLSPKLFLVCESLKRGLPLVSSMSAGGKTDPTLVQVADISKSHSCPLAKKMRIRLHRRGIFKGFPVVFSPEPICPDAVVLESGLNKISTVGTISYMPAVFGCACASVVIRALVGNAPS